MAEPARRARLTEDVPRYDPRNVERALREHRARRHARHEHKRRQQHARIRFFIVVVALLGLALFVGIVVWHQIQRLFGL
jgi:type VI protein secretion system component VasF